MEEGAERYRSFLNKGRAETCHLLGKTLTFAAMSSFLMGDALHLYEPVSISSESGTEKRLSALIHCLLLTN